MAWLAKYIDYAVIGSVSTAILGYQVVNGPWIHKVKGTFQMYREAKEVNLPSELRQRCQDVLKKAKIPKSSKRDIDFFLTSGDEPFTMGSLNNAFHPGIVGLPWNFVYNSVNDIDKHEMRAIDGQPIKWDSKSGQKLLESMVLSEKAQKFLIMRELYMLDNLKLYFIPLSMIVNALIARQWTVYLNHHPNINKVGFFMRFNGKFLGVLLSFTMFLMSRDLLHCHYQKKADERAIGHGDDYYEGALEYYGNVIKRNKAFRKMLGKDGDTYFTEDGAERFNFLKFLLRSRQTPVTERLSYINDLKTEHYEG